MQERFIEYDLPLAEISEQSAREKNIRHGHPSTLHIWWARRPLASSRATALAALIDNPGPDHPQEREEIRQLIEEIIPWEAVKSGNSPAIEQAREMILKQYGRPPRVLDPFAGGGSIPLEALRLGCETYASDYNPVAHLIELCTLVYPQKYSRPQEKGEKLGKNPLVADVRKWGQWVLDAVQGEIGYLYANPAGEENIVGYLWARAVTCPSCGAEIPLVRQWWLARKPKRRIALKPVVDRKARAVTFEIVAGDALRGFDPAAGTIRRGHVTCLNCGHVTNTAYIRAQAEIGHMDQVPLVVIYHQTDRGKGYRPFTDEDEALFWEAQALLAQEEDKIPDQSLSQAEGVGSPIKHYGLARWSDLFNARQLLILLSFSYRIRASYETMLAEGMDSERAKAVTTYLSLALDRLVNANSSLARWIPQRESSAGTLIMPSFQMIWDYVEVNSLDRSPGHWSAALSQITHAIEHIAQSSDRPATVQPGTATHLPYGGGYFDAIITDPPYYEAVHYADLSDFFYVWLKLTLEFLYPELFSAELSPKSEEIIQKSSDVGDGNTSTSVYKQGLTSAFAEACRVLDSNGVMVAMFPCRAYSSLIALIDTLSEAGLMVTASWPLQTERTPSYIRARTRDQEWLPSLILVVCRKQVSEPQERDYSHVRAQIRAKVREFLKRFRREDLSPHHLFISTIGSALGIFGQYRPVVKIDGQPATVSDVLHEVQEEIVDFCMVQELMDGVADG